MFRRLNAISQRGDRLQQFRERSVDQSLFRFQKAGHTAPGPDAVSLTSSLRKTVCPTFTDALCRPSIMVVLSQLF